MRSRRARQNSSRPERASDGGIEINGQRFHTRLAKSAPHSCGTCNWLSWCPASGLTSLRALRRIRAVLAAFIINRVTCCVETKPLLLPLFSARLEPHYLQLSLSLSQSRSRSLREMCEMRRAFDVRTRKAHSVKAIQSWWTGKTFP